MSENIDLVRALYPEGNLDWVAVLGSRVSEDAYLNQVRPLLHPEFEVAWVDSPGADEVSGAVVGLSAYQEALRRIVDAFEVYRITPERFVDLGDRVVVLGRLEARTRPHGVEVVGEGGAILTILDGKVRLLQEFPTRDELFAAAGITAEEAEERGVEPGP